MSRRADPGQADLALINARVISLDPRRRRAEAIAVRNGRVVPVVRPEVLELAVARTDDLERGRVALVDELEGGVCRVQDEAELQSYLGDRLSRAASGLTVGS